MAEEENSARFFHYAVYDAVQQIPYGKVTSYGHIAKLIYKPRNSRHVGQALKFLPSELNNELGYPYTLDNVPWWRVISSSGVISQRDENSMQLQKQKLTDEGVIFSQSNKISLPEFGWFPETEFDEYT